MNSELGTYGVLGVGSIARAIVIGLCEGVDDPPRIVLSPRGAAVSAELAGRYPTVSVAADNQDVVDGADLVIVCLRRADAALLGDLTWRPDQVVVSAVAGVGVPQLTEWVTPATRVCRSVPMPPVADRAGLTAVHPSLAEARALFDRLGTTLEMDGRGRLRGAVRDLGDAGGLLRVPQHPDRLARGAGHRLRRRPPLRRGDRSPAH